MAYGKTSRSRRRVYKRKRAARTRRVRARLTNKQRAGFQGNGQALLTINKGLGFPLRMRTKLRYVETQQITPAATGLMSTTCFKCNGLTDPNSQIGGHQPMYFDQFMTVYNHYKVIGSKITVDFIPTDDDIQMPVKIALWVNDDATFNYSWAAALELGLIKNYLQIGGQSANNRTRLTNTWSLKRFFKDKYNTTQVTGSATSDPGEVSQYMIGFQAVDEVSMPVYNIVVTIDYIVDFFELADVAQS